MNTDIQHKDTTT